MKTSSDSSQRPKSSPQLSRMLAEHASDIEAGLDAFKQGNYATAIALLETACNTHLSHPLTIKGLMGLAIAYQKLGEPAAAAQVCDRLLHHSSPQVQEWSHKTLSSLIKRHPDLASRSASLQPSEITAPITTIPASQTQIQASPDTPTDKTGFAPLPEDFNLAPTPAESRADAMAAANPNWPKSALSTPFSGAPSESIGPATTTADGPAPAVSYQPSWRNAERASQWKPLGSVKPWRLIVTQLITGLALFWFLQQLVYQIMLNSAILLTKVPFLEARRGIFDPPVTPIVFLLVVLFLSSQWLLDGLLTLRYNMQPLSLEQLAAHSPETGRSLAGWCQQRRIPVPKLGLLPTATPIIVSYGVLPWVARTVVSQGVLTQLAEDEIATLFANEVGHLSTWTTPLMSLITVLLQIPYQGYAWVSGWGDRQHPVLKGVAGLLASLCYGLYWLVRWVGLWLSRQRVYHSDRIAVNLTGNPNGYTRALLKLAISTAADIQQRRHTPHLLTRLEGLLPLGHRAAVPLGSLFAYTPVEPLLEWDRRNPYRHWLNLSQAYPPVGERLNLLTLYARHWHLDSELTWGTLKPTAKGLSGQQWRTLLLQAAPWVGLLLGIAIPYLLTTVGALGGRFGWQWVAWMASDRALSAAFPWLGLGVGIILRINPLFPELLTRSTMPATNLINALSDPKPLPVMPRSIQLQGQLLGRSGIANCFNQDLLIESAQGMIYLQAIAPIAPFGNLLAPVLTRWTPPMALAGQPLQLMGWLRRGGSAWLDLDTLKTSRGLVSKSYGPIWNTIAGAVACLWGIFTLFIA
jgi:Zn-dependent protease with chaperone function